VKEMGILVTGFSQEIMKCSKIIGVLLERDFEEKYVLVMTHYCI
jgi:hypothetical protein